MKSWLIIIAVLAAGGTVAFVQWKHPMQSAGAVDGRNHMTNAVAQLRDIQFTVHAAGEITPAEQVSVRPEVNGKISVLPVDIGDKVKKGQLLFQLDDQELQIQKASQLTEIAHAKLELEQNQRTFERSKKLFNDRLISLEAYEDAKTKLELSRNGLERADQGLHLIEDRLSRTKIAAPFDSTVLTRSYSVGQAVSGSGGYNAGTEVLTIADLSELVINAHINQAEVVRLKLGQKVNVQVESIPGLRLDGVVERIAPQATFKNSVKGYSARILLKNPDERVRPGMTANIVIPIASAQNVLTIPISAVFTEFGKKFVFVQKEGKYEQRPVDVGVSDYEFVEIRTGLAEGDVVSLEQVHSNSRPEEEAPRQNRTSRSASSGGSSNSSGSTPRSAATASTATPSR